MPSLRHVIEFFDSEEDTWHRPTVGYKSRRVAERKAQRRQLRFGTRCRVVTLDQDGNVVTEGLTTKQPIAAAG